MIQRLERLSIAKSKLMLALTLIRSASAETIANRPEYEMEYIGLQTSINKMIDIADMYMQEIESLLIIRSAEDLPKMCADGLHEMFDANGINLDFCPNCGQKIDQIYGGL